MTFRRVFEYHNIMVHDRPNLSACPQVGSIQGIFSAHSGLIIDEMKIEDVIKQNEREAAL